MGMNMTVCPRGHTLSDVGVVFRGKHIRCKGPGNDYDKTLRREICGCLVGEKGVSLKKKSDAVPEVTKSRIWKDIKTQKQASVEFECPMCGNFNHTKDWKQIDEEVFRVLCAECSSNCIVRG